MKIAFVGNFSQAHCTECHLALTFESMGHEVTRIQENTTDQNQLINIVEGHDLFFFVRTWSTLVTMEHLRQIKDMGIPSVSFHLDLYVGLQRESGLDGDPFWYTEYVFSPDGDSASAEVFKRKGINHFYSKPGVFKTECYMAEPDQYSGLGNPVIFVGGGQPTGMPEQYGHPEWAYRGELLKFLQDTFTYRYRKYGYPQRTIRNAELNQLYANSKVVVGDSLCLNFTHPYYWSDRVYETMGRGGFIIHPYIKGMEEEFTDGENIVFYEYNNWDQLKNLIEYYLEHDDERVKIRDAGHKFVKENATYDNRLQKVLEIVGVN